MGGRRRERGGSVAGESRRGISCVKFGICRDFANSRRCAAAKHPQHFLVITGKAQDELGGACGRHLTSHFLLTYDQHVRGRFFTVSIGQGAAV
ncbi:unnamed protein product [Caenorhabditis auriculariae]|uniref:Uncharacterized protein n=1 Tax=Caenorhabditis auriculariae TaxID=2777116 RepID=A0A8S1HCT9_9PELO|nr:unnamed protein product [Caenorhabditis auriculariae]